MRTQSGRKEINWASWTDDRTFEPNIGLVQEARYINWENLKKIEDKDSIFIIISNNSFFKYLINDEKGDISIPNLKNKKNRVQKFDLYYNSVDSIAVKYLIRIYIERKSV